MIGAGYDIPAIAQEVYEIEHHLHNNEKWFGVAAVIVGETHAADRCDGAIQPFAFLSGNSDFGAWVQILGSSDTPVVAGRTKMDGHRMAITNTDSVAPFVIQFIVGETADFAAKLLAEEFTEFLFIAATNNIESGITPIMSERANSGDKVWGRCACVGDNAKTISMYIGLHEYIR